MIKQDKKKKEKKKIFKKCWNKVAKNQNLAKH